MIEVVLRAVRVDVASSTPLLLLEEVGGDRVLAVFIGAPEATAIAYALQEVKAPRPMSHDLMSEIISTLGGKLFAVEITELRDNTFYAQLRLVTSRGEAVISARPSDGVALALRTGAPLLVSDELMDEQGQHFEVDEDDSDDEDDEVSPEELVAELRDFLESVNPEDFDL